MAKIEIDLADLGVTFDEDGDPVRNDLRGAVADKAARLVADHYRVEAGKAIQEQIDLVINQEITALVREVLAGPIQRRSSWGEKKGEPTTVLEIAREKLNDFFNKADRRDSYDRSQGQNLSGLVNDVVKQALTTELQPAIVEARKAVAAAVKERLSTAVANDLAKNR